MNFVAALTAHGLTGELLLLLLALPVYFLPCLVAWRRRIKLHAAGRVFLVNLLLGWTFLGWVVALVWAAAAEGRPSTATHPVYPDATPTQRAAKPISEGPLVSKRHAASIAHRSLPNRPTEVDAPFCEVPSASVTEGEKRMPDETLPQKMAVAIPSSVEVKAPGFTGINQRPGDATNRGGRAEEFRYKLERAVQALDGRNSQKCSTQMLLSLFGGLLVEKSFIAEGYQIGRMRHAEVVHVLCVLYAVIDLVAEAYSEIDLPWRAAFGGACMTLLREGYDEDTAVQFVSEATKIIGQVGENLANNHRPSRRIWELLWKWLETAGHEGVGFLESGSVEDLALIRAMFRNSTRNPFFQLEKSEF